MKRKNNHYHWRIPMINLQVFAGGDGSLYSGHAGHPCGGAEQLCESDYQADTENRVRAANNRPLLRRRKSAGERK